MGLLSEYIAKGMTANDLEQELLRLIGEYNKVKKTYLIVYSAAISKPIPAISLNMDDYYIIYDLLRSIKSDKLDFYLETPGGSGETAEEIVDFIRRKFSDIAFVISGEAKSAGTIMALSANDILMTRSGSLGPIDAQIRVGRSVVSGYDYMDWIQKRRKQAQRKGRLNPFDATMVAQISPGELNGANNALNFASDLVTEWLPKYKFKNWHETNTKKSKVTEAMKKKRAKEIVKDLINHEKWRSHGRSLKIDDLEEIGLQITEVDANTQLANIVYRIQTVIKLLFGSTNVYKIFATESEKIFSSATPVGATQAMPAPQQADVAAVDVKCEKCGRIHKLYAKFASNPKIDEEAKKQGLEKFPANNKFKCECGFEIDLTGIRNAIEMQANKKVIT